MASGKKGKKTKGKTLALTDFLQETPGALPTQPIRKSTTSWADEVDDYDGYDSRPKMVNVVLPTAPKASRDVEDISEKVPQEPPYIAYLSNLPYDVDEDEIALFFKNLRIANMKIPKNERSGEAPKLRGFGYVEFEDRDSLLNALIIPDTMLKNRRIRIEVAANVDNDRRRGGRMGDMGRSDRNPSDSFGDWRSGNRSSDQGDERRVSSFTREGMRDSRDVGRDRDRGFNRDRDFGRDRDSGFGRNRDQDDRPGAWRDGDRSKDVDRDRDRGFSRSNYRDSDRSRGFDDRDKDDRRGFNRRYEDREESIITRSNNRNGREDRDSESASWEPRQRPRLQLAPRTKPLENQPAIDPATAVPSAAIFGNAKPVDTSERERQIEEKLLKQQDDRLIEPGREKREGNRDVRNQREGSSERKDESNEDREESRARDSSRERSFHHSMERNKEDDNSKIIERGRPPSRREESDGDLSAKEKRGDDNRISSQSRKEHKSPADNKRKTEKLRKEDRKEKHEKEFPKLQEPEPPNFAASNKFAFLQEDDNSD
ncbi:eukaryotic translation initiation factor 4B [Cylas formicarius]|uniref:eukaryotic translation initiation factor 4B n=1 Tax=Cylas formicarius TaxID=197179 RepID=UPI0029587BFA|nr:eukaryotic translation initiation factor 4B [Cylas formicarius]